MAYKVIFASADGDTVEECILDSIPNVGDNIQITYYDANGGPVGRVDTFPVLRRTFAYDKYNRPEWRSTLGSQMHLVTVHVALGNALECGG